MTRSPLLWLLFLCFGVTSQAQTYHNYVKDFSDENRWQQHVDYQIEVDVNVNNYQYTGTQTLEYTNNSPDTLQRVFYHLYLNAFQPNSEMDIRSRTIADPDGRVKDRISKLEPHEIGYTQPTKLTHDGEEINYSVHGTVLKVDLDKPILPGE